MVFEAIVPRQKPLVGFWVTISPESIPNLWPMDKHGCSESGIAVVFELVLIQAGCLSLISIPIAI